MRTTRRWIVLAVIFLAFSAGSGCSISDAVVRAIHPELVTFAESVAAKAAAESSNPEEVEATVNAAVDKWIDGKLGDLVAKKTGDAISNGIQGNLPMAVGDLLLLLMGGGGLLAAKGRGAKIIGGGARFIANVAKAGAKPPDQPKPPQAT